MKKNLSTCITMTEADGSEKVFSTIEEAIDATGLTKRQLQSRATAEKSVKGRKFKWCDSTTRRSFLGKKSRRKGNSWELDIINALKEIGYTGCVSARSESKRTDDAKVDIVDLDNRLPCYIQAKATKNMPGYHKIESECPMKDKPFVIACKLEGKVPPVVILPFDFFCKLITPTR